MSGTERPGAEERASDFDAPHLGDAFARLLPEMAVPWRALRVADPAAVLVNDALAGELGLDADRLRSAAGARFLAGQELPESAQPVAQAYAGHQFGAYAPRLGDGRALLLGEIADAAGGVRELHLKGSGRTPFSRGADGFAAIGPMLREYVMGEAMHALGIPTTRALAVVATGLRVVRDDVLDVLPGAVLVRVASSHLRVGSFQYSRATGDTDLLRRLADFAIDRHYPHLAHRGAESRDPAAPYLGLLDAVVTAQASLTAQWMLVGFVHGVMNTDNVAISGDTIDYGPCAFLDAYDPATVFSSIDTFGRYAYGAQPGITGWNLARFAETLLPLLADDAADARALALAALERYPEAYDAAWTAGMRAKLGLTAPRGGGRADDDTITGIAADLLGELRRAGGDYTGAFRALGAAARGDMAAFEALCTGTGTGVDSDTADRPGPWFTRWLALAPDPDEMDATNPVYIPRNRILDAALAAATEGDLEPVLALLEAVTSPYTEREGFERFAEPGPPGRFVTYCGT